MNVTNYKWLVAYTKPRWEKKVAHLLSKKNIENYCPLYKEQRQWSDRKKMVEVPLFTSYVFVRIPTRLITEVRKTPGVLNILYWLSKPAIVREEEITTIKRFLSVYENVKIEQTRVSVKDKVRVLDGPFVYQEGEVIEVMNHSIKVLLPSLGYALLVKLDESKVELVNPIRNKSVYIS